MPALCFNRLRNWQEARVSVGSPNDAKEQVRQAVDIVELVGSYLQLRREGRGYKALCPWHDDSRPSLQVNPDRQSFRCWVCDIGGDVFSFMMKMENIPFAEAMAMLAERAGVKLASSRGSGNDDAKRLLYAAMAWAEEQYHDFLLKSPDAQRARDYLADRSITAETIAQFRLGYAPEAWNWLEERARDTRFTRQVLSTVGLLASNESSNRHYDRFRGRVLFSIRDPQGRPVGVGGRVLPGTSEAEKTAKYVNSPETPLFSKSNLLYGLDASKDAIAKNRTAIVMEGYTDCLVAHQSGFKNVVAVLGTALGQRHIPLLRRYADTIVLVLDGDEAGRRRTDQILELFVAEQIDLRIVTPPNGLDPADFLLQRGPAAFETLLKEGVDALEHKFRSASTGLSSTSGMQEVMQTVESVLATIARAPRLQSGTTGAMKLREDQVLHRMAQRSGLREERLRDRLTELRRGAAKRKLLTTATEADEKPVETEVPRMLLAERWLLQILIERPETLAEMRSCIETEQFSCPRRRNLFALACRLDDTGITPTFERLMLELDDPDMKNVLVELDEERQAMNRSDVVKELRDLLTVFREDRRERKGQMAERPNPPASSTTDEGQVLSELVSRLRSR
ncbi:MAG TPA: DNA primase, partial [Pirellulales bacterium]|nr:DNA primase [Pirellulales bacterium]